MSELDPRLLSTLRAVASSGKISAAARSLHLSQPAVTAQIRKLEAQCGRPLLTRSVRGIALTEAGERLVRHAAKMEDLLTSAFEDVSAAPSRGGLLHLGASTTSAMHLLPKLIAGFVRSVGPIAVRIEEGNSDDVLKKLEAGDIPLGIVEGPSRVPRVRLRRFVDDELVAVVAANAPRKLRDVRRASDLTDVPIIWREVGSGTRAVVERALVKSLGRKRRGATDLHPGGTAAIRAMALEGLGVAFLSRLSIEDDLARGTLRVLALADLRIPRQFSWALAAAEVPGLAGRFLRFASTSPT
jgi:molybdate transport repressor ModE-like protein